MTETDIATNFPNSSQKDHIKGIEIDHFSRISRLDDSLYSKELAPHYMQLATKLATSELIPKCFRGKPQDLFICWAMGYQVGLTPEQSQQCIAVINGKSAMYGDDMLALCMSHKDFEDIIETPILKNDAVIGYNCIVKRKGKTDKQSIFTLEMAKKAGLLGKVGPWTQYPERMLKLRARGFGLRDTFPDALKGIKPREEVEDYIIEADYSNIEHKGSRTEQLKQDIITKQGVSNVDLVCGFVATEENQMAIKAPEEGNESARASEDSHETFDVYLEIKRLITEKHFPHERLENALKYYEVDSVDELSLVSAEHFITKLKSL